MSPNAGSLQVFQTSPGQYIRIQKVVSKYDADPAFQGDIPVKAQLQALSSLDQVDKMDTLLAIGRQLATAYRRTLKRFAEEYLVPRRTILDQTQGGVPQPGGGNP
eukprot:jgi/Chrzof1/7965/UNPLg00025.t1